MPAPDTPTCWECDVLADAPIEARFEASDCQAISVRLCTDCYRDRYQPLVAAATDEAAHDAAAGQ